MPSHHLNDTNIHSLNIYLNSDEALVSISDSHKLFFLNNPIFANSNVKIVIGLTSFTCANSIYNIDSSNNSITIDSTTYTITAGNYDNDTIVTAINAVIPQTISFNESDMTFTISDSSSFTINSCTLQKVLGIKDDIPFTGTSITGSHICDLAGVTNFQIKLKNLSMNNLTSSGDLTNVIANINNNVNYGDYIFYTPSEIIYHAINDRNIKLIELEILDQSGNEVQLNGSSFALTLTVHFQYIRPSKIVETLAIN